MEVGAVREGKSAWEIAAFYTDAFRKDMARLRLSEPDVWCRATDHIPEQIAFIQRLEAKGFTYRIEDGVYFDTSGLPDYGKLARLDVGGLRAGTRVKVGDKRRPTDFALWRLSPPEQRRQMEWTSPWGTGFPGWHIECSVMSMKYLGEVFDIHCGGIDHIPVHHTDEIAQFEAYLGRPWVPWWLHGGWLVAKTGGGEQTEKMSKSSGNFIRLDTLIDRSPTSEKLRHSRPHPRRPARKRLCPGRHSGGHNRQARPVARNRS